MNWLFGGNTPTQLVLECPLCQNRLQFKAIMVKNQVIWNCEICNNFAVLQLVPLHTDCHKNDKVIYH